MRHWLALFLGLTLLVGVGCTKQVQGAAIVDPNQPLTTLSEDGFGVVAGFPNAPVRIEIFAEPQCSHCADLQRDFGSELRYYIGIGQLEVTYRPVTFLDSVDTDYSKRVSNALFVAAEGRRTPAVALQSFVEAVWSDQDPSGRGPSDEELADHAREAGVPDALAMRIANGETGVDTAAMDELNFQFLYQSDALTTGTPMVYDLVRDEVVDIYDNDWLGMLIDSA